MTDTSIGALLENISISPGGRPSVALRNQVTCGFNPGGGGIFFLSSI